ncbi:Carboxypeptidase B [Portunus trituberculatus]|uniref:Carboxypeptidase B n=1 Tax=Portunus trituberculatus TaxID=210409 RepID=A0A5B7DP71_PORTR|nr:Carboxypeptidase B [Portunus trituberculatus]
MPMLVPSSQEYKDWREWQLSQCGQSGIIQWLNSLVKDYPDLCTLEDVGKSYEDRAIKLLKVGKGGADKPVVFVESGMHAREWIAPATVTYMINKLVTNSTEYENLLSQVNFYFMPVTNPDGYDFTFMRSIFVEHCLSSTKPHFLFLTETQVSNTVDRILTPVHGNSLAPKGHGLPLQHPTLIL